MSAYPQESEIGQRVTIRLFEDGGGYRDLLGTLETLTSVRKRDGSLVEFRVDQIFVWKLVG